MSTKSNFASCLNCEALESRENPAGNVSVAISGGVIFVQGDVLDNHVRIEQNSAGDVFIFGVNNTTVNGQPVIFVGRGLPNGVQVQMGQGNDTVDVVGLATFGTLSIGLGLGNDRANVINVSASRSVEVYARDGDDTTFLSNVVADFMVLDGGNGGDWLHFDNTFARNGMTVLNTETFF